MRKTKGLILLLVLIPLLVGAQWGLRHHPLDFFVLKGSAANPEAFRLELNLANGEYSLQGISLTKAQKKDGAEILRSRNLEGLKGFAVAFGKWPTVIGIPGEEEIWPPGIGGGLTGLWKNRAEMDFDNLSWGDRAYLALHAKNPPPLPFNTSELQMENMTQLTAATPSATPLGLSVQPTPKAGILRVEILNGCGITNAADWLARRFKGSGLIVVQTGNADNFHYATTQVLTTAGLPVALEDALERSGLTKECIVEKPTLDGGFDVIVVLGKDYPKLKEKVRERRHHGAQ